MCSLAFFEQRRRLPWISSPSSSGTAITTPTEPPTLPSDLIVDAQGGEDEFLRRFWGLRYFEALLFLLLFSSLWVKRRFMGAKHFAKDASAIFHLVVLVLLALDFVYAPSANPPSLNHHWKSNSNSNIDASSSSSVMTTSLRLIFPPSHRILRFLRPFLIFEYFPSARKR